MAEITHAGMQALMGNSHMRIARHIRKRRDDSRHLNDKIGDRILGVLAFAHEETAREFLADAEETVRSEWHGD